ncbi:FAD-dependent oxidoreductase [Pedobacter lusitanus]|uniref:FAD-dependent oxidoreductase n=1 Tax=Pedobacter lusitanus TaxID=1503925 RepID=A0A0D0GLK3_9SPHI|nr:FAD-binding oxidoreductase [Pedobacter lusitanus]KIO77075.1 FAD-dependent oxidoreductase [Pedobacter lusitanus]
MNIRSNEPFWLVKNGLLYTYPSLRENISCDILIVGSGITGALMAHALTEKGYKTVLIDKREIANGSSSATTSMLQYEIDIPLYKLIAQIGEQGAVGSYRACRDSIYKLEKLINEIKSDCGFEKKDSVYFAKLKKDVGWLKKEFEARKAADFEVVWLTPEEIKSRYGLIAEGAILSKDGASVDAFRLAHDLLHYNAERGLTVYDKTKLEKVKYKGGQVLAQTEGGAIITAGKIVYCTGYETQEMLPEQIVKLKSTYAMVSEKNKQLKDDICNTLFWNTDAPYLYMRTTSDGRLLAGGEDEDFKNPVKRDALLERKKNKLVKTVSKFLPEVEFIEDFCWCGTFGETKDGLPYIGEHPKFPDTYFVLGFGGNGITFSVMGMEIISAMLEGELDLLSYYFRFRR